MIHPQPRPPTGGDTIQPDLTTITKFLASVWRLQPDAEFSFVSTKDWETGTWSDHALYSADPDPADLPPIATEHLDLYFSPHLFTGTRRTRRMSSERGRWLYADLDEVTPTRCAALGVTPTLAWETSPGRYQCMWLLDKPIPRRRLEQLNQRMTYYVGADRGGWSLTKVLRVPGSVSHKRDDPHRVRLMSNTKTVHAVTDLTELLRDVDTSSSSPSTGTAPAEADIPPYATLMRRHRKKMTARARQLIRTEHILQDDDRSSRLWELETSLLRSGIKPRDVLGIVRHTKWNKWAGQRRELTMLWRDITKAAAHIGKDPTPVKPANTNDKGLLPNSLWFDDFMARDWERPEWLVEHVWTAGAYGILAGEYKSFKTMLLLDLALAVASGTPFLGKHKVVNPGTVLYIHEEGREWSVHERIVRIGTMKGVIDHGTRTADPGDHEITFAPHSLPICITSLPRLNLTDETSQAKLIQHIESTRPKLVILETFYLMSGGVSESAIEEVSPMLEFIAHISHEYGCAVILSHHFHKSNDDKRTFDRTSGSNIFLRWYESAMFVERHGPDEDNTIRVHSSHRDGAYSKRTLQLIWDEEDDASFNIRHIDEDDPAEHVVELPEITTERNGRGASVTKWRASLAPGELQHMVTALLSIREEMPLKDVGELIGCPRTEWTQSVIRTAQAGDIEKRGSARWYIPNKRR